MSDEAQSQHASQLRWERDAMRVTGKTRSALRSEVRVFNERAKTLQQVAGAVAAVSKNPLVSTTTTETKTPRGNTGGDAKPVVPNTLPLETVIVGKDGYPYYAQAPLLLGDQITT